jgi:hypothetical protein
LWLYLACAKLLHTEDGHQYHDSQQDCNICLATPKMDQQHDPSLLASVLHLIDIAVHPGEQQLYNPPVCLFVCFAINVQKVELPGLGVARL